MFPQFENTNLFLYLNEDKLKQIANAWSDTYKYFTVKISSDEMNKKINEKLTWLSGAEGRYWLAVWDTIKDNFSDGIEFLCLALDSNGNPIKIANSDVASLIFIREIPKEIALKSIKILTVHYPAGLFIPEVGISCANDSYEGERIWNNFKNDRYHSPFVIWGREINLIFLGLIKQIKIAIEKGDSVYADKLKRIFYKIYSAVESSGLKHSELWTYKITNGKLSAVRYPISSDVQLWNLTNLAVEFYIEKLNLR